MGDTVTAKIKKPEEEASAAVSRRAVFSRGKILALSIAGGVTAAAMIASAIALSYPKIYSGIHFETIPLGGKSVDEAKSILSAYSDELFSGKTIELRVDGISESFQVENVSLPVDDIAQDAYDLGHNGNPFSRIGFVISSLFSQTEVEAPSNYIDPGIFAGQVEDLARRLDEPALEYATEITADSIIVTNAKTGRKLPQEPLRELLAAKFSRLDFSPIAYQTDPLPPVPLDLQQLYDSVHVEPQDAFLDISDKTDIKIMPHVIGVSFDIKEAEALQNAGGDSFAIPLSHITPEMTQEMLKDRLFRDTLSEFKTGLGGSSASRINNITTAASYINGTILLPGDTFSYNTVVGERTAARGFQTAGAYVNGRIVDEIGGGICQVSSTLYNSALLANLQIVERQNHSMLVSYVLPGMDATVNWGTIDLRFSNNTGYPLRIHSWVDGKTLHTSFTGTKTDDTSVSMEQKRLSTSNYTVIKHVNPALAPGTKKVLTPGHTGVSVQTYRIVMDSQGNEISREPEAKSVYRKVDEVQEIGPDLATQTPDNGITPATPNEQINPDTPDTGDTPNVPNIPTEPANPNNTPETGSETAPTEPVTPETPNEAIPPTAPADSSEDEPPILV